MSLGTSRFRRPEHSEIKHKNMRFLITDRPTDSNVERYIDVSFAKTSASLIVLQYKYIYI